MMKKKKTVWLDFSCESVCGLEGRMATNEVTSPLKTPSHNSVISFIFVKSCQGLQD